MNGGESPASRILAGDPWYTDDQFRAQLGTAGRRRVVEHRWQVFSSMIDQWRVRRPTKAPMTVLDAGCGDGINMVGLSQIAAKRGWTMRLFAVDYNPLRLSRARQHVSGLAVQLASLCALPYSDRRIDIVLCSHVLEHVPDTARALAELRRVLVLGGLLIVAVPNEGCAMGRLRNRVLQPHLGRTTDHAHFFTEETLTSLIERAGFRVQRLERETFFFPIHYINMLLVELPFGHALMRQLCRWVPSQAGGLMIAALRD